MPGQSRGEIVVAVLLSIAFMPLLPSSSAAPQSAGLPEVSPVVQSILDTAVTETLAEFAPQKLESNQLAVTVIDLTHPDQPARASYRGEVQIYPASVVKLFYLVAAHRWMEDGRLEDTDELRRAMRDMIVESYNEPTHYIIDLLTGTTSGPELAPAELEEWWNRRNAVNRYFTSLGYTNINVNKKPWCEGPYGRETQAIKAFRPNRNMLTTDATARLMSEIVAGQAVSARRSAEMLALMKREVADATESRDDQAKFSGPALPPGSRLWSKAGWTSETRHDATCVELPGGRRLILVIFTVGHANESGIIHGIVRRVTGRMRRM